MCPFQGGGRRHVPTTFELVNRRATYRTTHLQHLLDTFLDVHVEVQNVPRDGCWVRDSDMSVQELTTLDSQMEKVEVFLTLSTSMNFESATVLNAFVPPENQSASNIRSRS